MFEIINFALVNLLLSSDNVVVIALFGEELEKKKRIPVLFWSMLASATLQLGILYLTSFLFRVKAAQSLFGIIVCYMAIHILHKNEPKTTKNVNYQSSISLVGKIVAGNLMMSFENEATLIGLSRGNVLLAWLAILLSAPLIFFASNIISWFLRRFDFIIYIGSIILIKIGLDMIFTLPVFRSYLPVAPWVLTGSFTIYASYLYLHKHSILKLP